MAAPGTVVTVSDEGSVSSPPTDTGVWFVAGLADKGGSAPILVRSLTEFVSKLGGRVSYSSLYDAIDVFFQEGGARAYIARVVGAAAAPATVTLLDGAGTPAATLTVNAISPGDWGNDLSVAVLAGDAGGEFKLQISSTADGVLETSPSLVDKTAAIAWAASSSSYVTLVDEASALDPAVVAATPLTGGTDDRDSIGDADYRTALARFTSDYGPGQVSMPGRTTDTAHADLLAHAAAFYRVALLDAPDTPTVLTLTGSADAARTNGRWGGLFAPWAVVPGVTAGTTRTVPYSAVEAGIIARNDGNGESQNLMAAGNNGVSRYALGLSQPAWDDLDRSDLNDAGVNVARYMGQSVHTYGYRSLAADSDPVWKQLNKARMLMTIAADCYAIGEGYVFRQIDGRGITLAAFAGDVSAVLNRYYAAGSLYGATAADAFTVDVGADVNTPDTIAAGELRATISVRISPGAEFVNITIVNQQLQGVS